MSLPPVHSHNSVERVHDNPRRHSRQWFAVRGILYKGSLARNPRCSRRRRIDEADISVPVAVDQRAANCLGKVYGHSPPYGAGINRHALTSPSVVHCQFFELFGARRSPASKTCITLWNCSTTHELLLRDMKETDNPPP
ncbi:uncharacterized protein TNCV_4873741 [Trichonephila clavipes]|nr:uncharacterized protein TNCV_4873741 [Trichonephila clavipes]